MIKRARSYSEGSKRYLSSDPESILQYLDGITSDEDSGSEFEGYVTEDDNLEDDDATTTRFSQNACTHTSYDDVTHTPTDYNTHSCQSESHYWRYYNKLVPGLAMLHLELHKGGLQTI